MVFMTAEPIWNEFHAAVERLPPARARRILRLVVEELDAEARHVGRPGVVSPDAPLSWARLQSSAAALPSVDPARFRADLENAVDEEFGLGIGGLTTRSTQFSTPR
jgi:hypothetical protein